MYYNSPLDLEVAERLRVVSIVCHHEGRGFQDDDPHVIMHMDERGRVLYQGPRVKEEVGRNAYLLREDAIRRSGREPRLPESAADVTSVRMKVFCECGIGFPLTRVTEMARRCAAAGQWVLELKTLSAFERRLKPDTP